MDFDIRAVLEYRVQNTSTFVFNIAAADSVHQSIATEDLTITPSIPWESYTDPISGNRYQRFVTAAGHVSLNYSARATPRPVMTDPTAIISASPDRLPMHTLPYLLPSRYCQSDHLMRLANREFGSVRPGYPQVKAICDWIYANVDYLAGSTGPLTSAFDTATQRAGVCRDFAHLGIAFCRAVNIPARFVSGYAYALQPPDFHAMFEVWLGDRWYLFDPTRQISPLGLVRIGTGRDAADASFALIFGPVVMTYMEVSIRAVTDGYDDSVAEAGDKAISAA